MLSQQIAKYSCLSVTLDDEQDKQMSEIVATVEENPDLRTQLNEVLLEADQHNEGHGALLQEMWETDLADRELVKFKDQQRNSKYTEVIQDSVFKLLGWGRDVQDLEVLWLHAV